MYKSINPFKCVNLIIGIVWIHFLISFSAFSQHSYVFSKDKYIFTGGIGYYNLTDDYANPLRQGTIGPLNVRFEIGLSDMTGAGVSVNYLNSHYDNSDRVYGGTHYGNYELNIISWGILFRLDFHFFVSDRADCFWGAGIGYNRTIRTETLNYPVRYSSDNNSFPIGLEMTGGIRYFLTPNLGFFIEAGLAKTLIHAGIAICL